MKKEKAIETLQMDIVIPDIVQQRADLVFGQIKQEKAGKTMIYSGKAARKGMWIAVAAVVLVLGTVACAAYMHWSSGMEEKFNVTQEQKEYLEESQITMPMSDSVTKEGITVTVQQSIVDAHFAHLSFRVDGYHVEEGVQPDFEYVVTTVDGAYPSATEGSFFDNLHVDSNGNFTYTDGTPVKETADGSIIVKYENDDGSMEYIMTLMTNQKDNSFIGKPIHIEFQNLGTVSKAVYTPDINATWTFDFTLEASEQVRTIELSQPLGDSGAIVTKAEISPISFYVEYNFPLQKVGIDGVDEAGNAIQSTTFAEAPRLTGVRLKDGTQLTGITQGGSEGYNPDDTNTYILYCAIDHIIDPAEVDALLFVKTGPETQQEYYNMPEDKLYIVPLN
ncbi:MAG: DUF4179 domain-containing protein [Lachnospiraceae bacterium]|nr:DUF4179 domain-containing protein [Lachnospiraceae bacterium]MDE7204764.1 DUF4179 domain-containing protein [Lachnospiraceae bacterium]